MIIILCCVDYSAYVYNVMIYTNCNVVGGRRLVVPIWVKNERFVNEWYILQGCKFKGNTIEGMPGNYTMSKK